MDFDGRDDKFVAKLIESDIDLKYVSQIDSGIDSHGKPFVVLKMHNAETDTHSMAKMEYKANDVEGSYSSTPFLKQAALSSVEVASDVNLAAVRGDHILTFNALGEIEILEHNDKGELVVKASKFKLPEDIMSKLDLVTLKGIIGKELIVEEQGEGLKTFHVISEMTEGESVSNTQLFTSPMDIELHYMDMYQAGEPAARSMSVYLGDFLGTADMTLTQNGINSGIGRVLLEIIRLNDDNGDGSSLGLLQNSTGISDFDHLMLDSLQGTDLASYADLGTVSTAIVGLLGSGSPGDVFTGDNISNGLKFLGTNIINEDFLKDYEEVNELDDFFG